MKKNALRLLALIAAAVLLTALSACGRTAVNEKSTAGPVVTDTTDTKTAEPDATASGETTAPPTAEPTAPPTAEPTEPPTEAPTEEPAAGKLLIPYSTKGLVALYEGNYNTENGPDTEAATWQDLSGNGNGIDLTLSDACAWNENGLYVSAQKIVLPEAIAELINSDEYTVEISIKDFEITGADYATFLNSDGNDNFALFIRRNDDTLEFKCNNGIGQRPNMVGNAVETCRECTIAVTFISGDVVELYVNGELIADRGAASTTGIAGNMFIGHPDRTRSYNATITGLRFYDRALTEKELAANHAALGTVAANPDYVPEG